MSAFSVNHDKHLFIRSCDDVREIIKRRIAWYGLADIRLQSIEPADGGKIIATIIDQSNGNAIREVFQTALRIEGEPAEIAEKLAA